jgi:RsiW-degrading membrane proteinase PrsW (M82 family)
MTTSPLPQPQAMPGASLLTNDRAMAIIAGAGATLSVGALVARTAGLMPAGESTIVALIGATIGLRIAFVYAAKSASAPARARVLALVSTVGLCISAVTMLGALPHLTQKGGVGTFATDLVAELWALALLMAAAASVRTLGWRAFVGAGMTGFLGIPALAALVGRPIVEALGTSSLVAVSLWVPLTEELCKAIPIAFVLVIALRRTTVRPSALDLMLLGAWTGAGFALYENAVYGRARFNLSAVPIVSLIFPTEFARTVSDWTSVQAGHLVFSGLVGIGVGLAVLYRKQFKHPWLILVAVLLVSLLEHSTVNALAASRGVTALSGLGLTLTLGGRLSSLLLLAGVGYALYLERRAIGGGAWWSNEFSRLSPTEARRRSMLLARAQHASPASVTPVPVRSV